MTDQQSEQDQNLADVLGFDPNESTGETLPPSVTANLPDHRNWPENWRELFRKRAEILKSKDEADLFYLDEENLFVLNDVGGNPNKTSRSYQRLDRDFARFIYSSSLEFDSDQSQPDFSVETWFDNENVVTLSFAREGNIDVGKSINNRHLSAWYDYEGGYLQGLDLYIANPTNKKLEGILLKKDSESGKWILPDAVSPAGEIEIEEDIENDTLLVRRINDGKVVDEMDFPLKIDKQSLLDKLFPQKLLDNPRDHDTNLDNGWRGRDFFHDAGLRWNAVADDSFHSLTQIPEPAPDQ